MFIALLFLLAGLLVLLDSAPGHRFIVDQLSRMETQSGLKIRIGRIDGSIFGKSQLRNVTVADGRGVFLTSPNIKLDWTPGAWLDNKLHVDSLTAERVSLIRLPALKPTTRKGPILPGFDIHIGELRIDRLDIGPGVGGKARSGSVRGKADVNHGRALVELAAVMNNGGDRIAFHLDAEPDRNKFDIWRAGDRARRRAVPGADRHPPGGQPRHRRQGQLDAVARKRGARPLGPADGAAGARRRQRPLPPPGPMGAGAIPDRQVAAPDRSAGHDPRRCNARRTGCSTAG